MVRWYKFSGRILISYKQVTSNVSHSYFCRIDLCDLLLKGNELEYFVLLCGENVFYIVNDVNLGNRVSIVAFFLIYA